MSLTITTSARAGSGRFTTSLEGHEVKTLRLRNVVIHGSISTHVQNLSTLTNCQNVI